MDSLPLYIPLLFVVTTFLSVGIFYKAAGDSKITLLILFIWLALQTIIGLSGFYKVTDTIPPRFVLLVLPPLLLIIIFFTTARGKQYLNGLDIKWLTILHTIRIPVELVLFWLFIHKGIPELMTFEGRNFDILSGLTAPIIFYFGFIKKQIGRKLILIWNFVCLGLLINIVAHAILASPFPFQQFAFEQPNIAVLYFPYVWLPCCIVPLVLLSHLASIRHLVRKDLRTPASKVSAKSALL